MDLTTAEDEHQHEHGDLVVDIEIDDDANGSIEAVAVPQEGTCARMGAVVEFSCDTDPDHECDGSRSEPEHEEGEISDDNEQAIEDHATAEQSGSAAKFENDCLITEGNPSLLDHTPIFVKPVINPYSQWSGRLDNEGRQHGWGWRTEATSFSAQPDHFYQVAWAKGVQGSPKESAADSAQDDAGNTTAESLQRDSRVYEDMMRCYPSFRDGSVRASKPGDSDAGVAAPLHRSTSWSTNRDVESLLSMKAAWLVGDRGIDYSSFMRSDTGYLWDEGGDWSEQRKGPGVEIWKGRADKGFVFNHGMTERPVTIRSTVEKVEREIFEPEKKNEIRAEERNAVGTLRESFPIRLKEQQPRKLDSTRIHKGDRHRNEKEEGELEEGEIQGDLLAQHTSIQKLDVVESSGLGLDKQVRSSKSREKQAGKSSERTYSQSSSKELRHQENSNHRHATIDYDRDRLLAECAQLVRNVAVKDAQKSFIDVCMQLRKALKLLRDLNKLIELQDKHSEGHRRRISALTRQAFSGIRAAYAVRNTAIGKEQEQDTDYFPRLLELANGSCQKLFTSKQIKELESMMQTIGRHSKVDHAQKTYGKASLQIGTSDEKDFKFGESSANTSATTQLESESTTDTSATGRTLDLGDEEEQAAHPSVGQTHGDGMLEDVGGISTDETPAASVGYGGWFSVNPEQGQVQVYANSMGMGMFASQMPTNNVELSYNNNKSAQIYVSGSNVACARVPISDHSGRASQEASSKNHPWPSPLDPVSAMTSYHEKFANRMAYARLPSPTPSDEDDEARSSSHLEAPVSAVSIDSSEVQSGKKEDHVVSREAQAANATSSSSFFPALGSAQLEALSTGGNALQVEQPELRLFPSSGLTLVENGDVDVHKARSLSMTARGTKKNRDPRRRLVNQPFDFDLPQIDASGNQELEKAQKALDSGRKLGLTYSLGELWPARQHLEMLNYENPSLRGELHAPLALPIGGWLPPEQPVEPSVLEKPVDMDVHNEEF